MARCRHFLLRKKKEKRWSGYCITVTLKIDLTGKSSNKKKAFSAKTSLNHQNVRFLLNWLAAAKKHLYNSCIIFILYAVAPLEDEIKQSEQSYPLSVSLPKWTFWFLLRHSVSGIFLLKENGGLAMGWRHGESDNHHYVYVRIPVMSCKKKPDCTKLFCVTWPNWLF